jgi:hypothetical protein
VSVSDDVLITETDSAAGTPGVPGTLSTSVGRFRLRSAGSGFALEATSSGTLGAPVDTVRLLDATLVLTHIPLPGSGATISTRVYAP